MIMLKKEILLNGTLKRLTDKYFNIKDPVFDEYVIGAEIIIEIQRDFQYYIFKVISPIILILLVCWSVFLDTSKRIRV